MRLTKLFSDFFESEKAGGLILIICTALSLLLANIFIGESYLHFWQMPVFNHPLEHWINDGLLTIFFLLIGLELEREIYSGELSTLKSASLPLFGALDGMLVPAFIYYFFNKGLVTQSGFGIPMATDIAFAIGILSLLGSNVPASLKVFLTALAVMDDLGAIVVIALFYSSGIVWLNFMIAMSVLLLLFIFNRLKINNIIPYLIGGVIMWYFMLQSGIHATITGVLLAFVLPYGDGEQKSISYQLQHVLHKPVAYFILPLFALANTAVIFNSGWLEGLVLPNNIGVIVGLVMGKPVGILLFTVFAIAIGACTLPSDLNWKHILGAGILGGIGFTMSIFITLLAFDNNSVIVGTKIAILLASVLSGALGYLWLKMILKP